MGRLMETVGNYAEIPYYIAQIDTSVYCVEELCFALSENTFLLDGGLLDQRLVRWLERECGLRELAARLSPLVGGRASLGAFVRAILEYAHFGTEKKRGEIEELFRLGADADMSVRRKNFADYQVEHGRFVQALAEYEKALREMPDSNHEARSQVLHNKGVALSRLFSFEEAAAHFLAAYQENPENKEAAQHYLAALRMSLSEADYIGFIADHPEWHGKSLEVEKEMRAAQASYEESGAFRKWKETFEGRDVFYYETVSGMLEEMQKNYREMVAQP